MILCFNDSSSISQEVWDFWVMNIYSISPLFLPVYDMVMKLILDTMSCMNQLGHFELYFDLSSSGWVFYLASWNTNVNIWMILTMTVSSQLPIFLAKAFLFGQFFQNHLHYWLASYYNIQTVHFTSFKNCCSWTFCWFVLT